MGHLVFVQQSLADLDDVATFLRGLLHLPGQQEARGCHHPPTELTKTLEHEEPVEEDHPRGCRLVTTAPPLGKPTRTQSPRKRERETRERIQSKCVACVYDEPRAFPAVANLRGECDSIFTRGALMIYLLSSKVPVEIRHVSEAQLSQIMRTLCHVTLRHRSY